MFVSAVPVLLAPLALTVTSTAPDALQQLKKGLKAMFRRKSKKKTTESAPAAAAPAEQSAQNAAPAAAAAEAKPEAPAPAAEPKAGMLCASNIHDAD